MISKLFVGLIAVSVTVSCGQNTSRKNVRSSDKVNRVTEEQVESANKKISETGVANKTSDRTANEITVTVPVAAEPTVVAETTTVIPVTGSNTLVVVTDMNNQGVIDSEDETETELPVIDPMVGSEDSLEPIVSVIELGEDHQPVQNRFENHGSEFWLYDANAGSTGFVAFGNTYRPYRGDSDLYRGVEVSEVGNVCMKQASYTLKAIEENPPQAWLDFKEKYGNVLSFFGWINDYSTLTENTELNNSNVRYYGPFNWQGNGTSPGDDDYTVGGYVKWSGAIAPNGTCTTPSLGEFLQLLRVLDNCVENPGASCTSIN